MLSSATETMNYDRFKSGDFSSLHRLFDNFDVNSPSQFPPISSTNLSGQKKFIVNRRSLNHRDAETNFFPAFKIATSASWSMSDSVFMISRSSAGRFAG
jgi:hypothetical protein